LTAEITYRLGKFWAKKIGKKSFESGRFLNDGIHSRLHHQIGISGRSYKTFLTLIAALE
jgi:hypothetical protein